jgi:hypothetical protein
MTSMTVTPLGLSGTMQRKDGLMKVLQMFLGDVVHKYEGSIRAPLRSASRFSFFPICYPSTMRCNQCDKMEVDLHLKIKLPLILPLPPPTVGLQDLAEMW